ncbi:MAG: epimerase, partial [Gemmatimonadaceae bacterium]
MRINRGATSGGAGTAMLRRAAVLANIGLALACKDDVPVAPPQPRVVNPVVKVVVSAARQSLS